MRICSKTHDESFFEKFSPGSCYVAGCFCADGCMKEEGRGHGVSFGVTDKDWIEVAAKAVGYNRQVAKYTYKLSNQKDKFHFSLYGHRTFFALKENFFLFLRKSGKECWPLKIPTTAGMFHFLRGYFDGDGSVWEENVGNKRYLRARFHGGELFLENLKSFLEENGILPAKVVRADTHVWSLTVSRKDSIRRLYKKLYHHSGGLRMPRKYNIFRTFYAEAETQRKRVAAGTRLNFKTLSWLYFEKDALFPSRNSLSKDQVSDIIVPKGTRMVLAQQVGDQYLCLWGSKQLWFTDFEFKTWFAET